MTLVSKRWRRCFYSEPALWRSFELCATRPSSLLRLKQAQQPAWFAARYALLQRTAHWVETATFGRAASPSGAQACSLQQALDRESAVDGWQLADFVALLPPGTLTCLRFRSVTVPAIVLRLLPRFSSLAALEIYTAHLPEAAGAVLGQLAHLADLYVKAAGGIPADVFGSLPRLTWLTSLYISSSTPFACDDLSSLSHLTALQSLNLTSASGSRSIAQADQPGQQAPVLQLPRWAAFPSLRRYSAWSLHNIQVRQATSKC